MKSVYLLSTVAIMATSASAWFGSWYSTEFTFNDGKSISILPVQLGEAHSSGYNLTGNYLNPKEVQATSECVRNAGGIKSVAISSIFDFANTQYCIQGYDVESCDEHKDIIGMTWDTGSMSKLASSLHASRAVVDILKLAVNILLTMVWISRQRWLRR
jgi:hypothetical protein